MADIQRFWYLVDILDALENQIKTNDKTQLAIIYARLCETIERHCIRERATLIQD
jgi:hypothetical protein